MRFRLSLALALAAVGAVSPATVAPGGGDDARLRPGVSALARGDGAAARLAFERAAAQGVAVSVLALPMAEAFLLQGDVDAASRLLAGAPATSHAQRLRGLLALRTGDAATALELLEQAQALGPASASTRVALARARLAGGDRRDAEREVEAALALDPKDAAALVLGGNLVRDGHGLVPALAWYDRALAVQPGRLDALFERAATLGDAGRATDALAATRALLAASPNNAQAFYLQAVIAARAGNWELTRQLMLRVGPRLDAQPGAILVRALAELEGGNRDGAVARLRALLAMQPGNVRARRLLGLAHWRAGAHGDAIAVLRPLAEQGDGSALILSGRAFEALGDRVAAAEMLDRAANAQPKLPAPTAMAALDGFLAANPAHPGAQRAAADRALAQGEFAAAKVLYDALERRLGARDPVRLANAGWAALGAGDPARARALALGAKAHALAPMNALAAASYGAFLQRGGQAERAVVLLELAVARAPDEPRFREELGVALAKARRAQ
ncbi:MAG: tetratricopeptide repeat protein [Sphingomonadaceae bacterium]